MGSDRPDEGEPRTIDVTGLPEEAVGALEEMAKLLRDAEGPMSAAVESLLALIDQARSSPTHGTPPSDASGGPFGRSRFTQTEFERKLGELAGLGTGQILPPDFSRADLYDDHD